MKRTQEKRNAEKGITLIAGSSNDSSFINISRNYNQHVI